MNKPEDYTILDKGIQQILGKEEYPEPELIKQCNHISDGFVYEETPFFYTTMCTKCREHYDIKK